MNDDPPQRRDDSRDKAETPRSSPYPMRRLAPPHDLVDVARQIAQADAMIGATAAGKLEVIADQIRSLQDEARRILEQTRADLDLHRARCSFVRRPGHVYHLYRKPGGEAWFSMIGPTEWGESMPGQFAGSYRLELDQSWTRVDGEHADTPRPSGAELVRKLVG